MLDKFLGSLKLPKWFELGDNELRYILWRSKERLERGKEHPIDLARDIVKRKELGLGEDNTLYSETKKDAHPTRLQTSDDAQAVQRDAHLSGTKVEINSENREEIEAVRAAAVERRKAESVQQDGDAEAGSGGSKNTGGSGRGTEETPTLTHEEAISLIARMEERADVAPEIDLTIENWDTLFGESGIVNTPIGEVKMGENQFAKLMRQGREGKLGMIKPTLEHPHAIVEDASEAKGDKVTERASSYVFIRSFKKADGSRYYYFTSVTVSSVR